MKAGIFVILYAALVTCCLSLPAEDTADQAAARAALEQKFYELDHPDALPTPDTNSLTTVAKPAEPTTTVAASSTLADSSFITNIPSADAAAQAAALTAVEQKMNELDQSEARPSSATRARVPRVEVPANEASASATPVMEIPAAEAPVAVTPAIASAAIAPVSVAPAVVAPAPKISAAPAPAAVAVVPMAGPGPDAMSTRTLPANALPASSAGQARPANELVTTTGATYRNVEVQKVASDGIVISYTPVQGGWAMTKLYFRDLPPEIRQEYAK